MINGRITTKNSFLTAQLTIVLVVDIPILIFFGCCMVFFFFMKGVFFRRNFYIRFFLLGFFIWNFLFGAPNRINNLKIASIKTV